MKHYLELKLVEQLVDIQLQDVSWPQEFVQSNVWILRFTEELYIATAFKRRLLLTWSKDYIFWSFILQIFLMVRSKNSVENSVYKDVLDYQWCFILKVWMANFYLYFYTVQDYPYYLIWRRRQSWLVRAEFKYMVIT